jgi:hypothetical protein
MNSSLQDGAENAMSIRIGYLLPTRERIMAEQPQAAPSLELAERAERLASFSPGRCTSEIADLKAALADFRATLAGAPYHGWPPTKPSHLSCRGCRREELN